MNTKEEIASLKTRKDVALAELAAVAARLEELSQDISEVSSDAVKKLEPTKVTLSDLVRKPKVVDINAQRKPDASAA
jgi:hypothetical protein